VADLVEADDNVAGGEQARDGGFEVIVDFQATVLGSLRARRYRQFGADVDAARLSPLSNRRIDK
jgi:hypothetical protein